MRFKLDPLVVFWLPVGQAFVLSPYLSRVTFGLLQRLSEDLEYADILNRAACESVVSRVVKLSL